jgi:L-methionine (R)-S-oxide reductase
MTLNNPALEQWLRAYISASGGVAGTIHARDGENLLLRAAVNIPPQVVAVVGVVPRGKGMAGLAFERDSPVQTCNLQDDDTGDVRPGAKAVSANAAVAIPVHGREGAVRGIVGVAFQEEREIYADELVRLTIGAESAPF